MVNAVALTPDGRCAISASADYTLRVWDIESGICIAAFTGDHQLSKWGKEKLLSNPDMIRQRALAIAHDHGAFEKAFSHPCAVKVDDQYRIAVLDHTRGRIQVYTKSNDPVLV